RPPRETEKSPPSPKLSLLLALGLRRVLLAAEHDAGLLATHRHRHGLATSLLLGGLALGALAGRLAHGLPLGLSLGRHESLFFQEPFEKSPVFGLVGVEPPASHVGSGSPTGETDRAGPAASLLGLPAASERRRS